MFLFATAPEAVCSPRVLSPARRVFVVLRDVYDRTDKFNLARIVID